jgi:hypothetical protein
MGTAKTARRAAHIEAAKAPEKSVKVGDVHWFCFQGLNQIKINRG